VAGEPQKLFQVKYGGPYTGINVTDPENEIPKESTPSALNFWLRNNEIRSRAKNYRLIDGASDNRPFRALSTFLDANYFVHTVGVTATGLWQLNPNWNTPNATPDWNQVGGFTTPGPDVPYPYATFINKFYFCNGSSNLFYWDGNASSIQTASTVAGGLFLIELDAHLLLAYTIEAVVGVSTPFPQRIRWSVSGSPTIWDPAVNIGAGFNDMLDVPDEITGLIAMGRDGYVLRRNGITQITPVGKGSQPFNFNHLWAADTGIGCIYPNATSTYGSLAIFISTEEIYEMSPNSFNPIAGSAKDAIYTDLFNATGAPIGGITPRYTPSFIYLKYSLFIPQATGLKHWIYDLTKKNWTAQFYSGKTITCAPRYILTA
jgi:hypothetical protein